jgi:hypothetical protein
MAGCRIQRLRVFMKIASIPALVGVSLSGTCGSEDAGIVNRDNSLNVQIAASQNAPLTSWHLGALVPQRHRNLLRLPASGSGCAVFLSHSQSPVPTAFRRRTANT